MTNFLVLLLMMGVPLLSAASDLELRDARWRTCNPRHQCSLLSMKYLGRSAVLQKTFAREIVLDIFDKKTSKTAARTLRAERGFLLDDKTTWALMDAHEASGTEAHDYYFNTDLQRLTRLDGKNEELWRNR